MDTTNPAACQRKDSYFFQKTFAAIPGQNTAFLTSLRPRWYKRLNSFYLASVRLRPPCAPAVISLCASACRPGVSRTHFHISGPALPSPFPWPRMIEGPQNVPQGLGGQGRYHGGPWRYLRIGGWVDKIPPGDSQPPRNCLRINRRDSRCYGQYHGGSTVRRQRPDPHIRRRRL